MLTDEQIKGRIIRKLHRHKRWGAKHTSFENIQKGFLQSNVGKQGSKRINKIVELLIKENLILSKPTGYGLEISLNPKMRYVIHKYLDEE